MGLSLRLAQPRDDAAVLRFLSGHVMPGPVRFRSACEPSLQRALAVHGRSHQLLLAEDEDGAPAGLALRSLGSVHAAGAELPCGRLGLLRLSPAGRGRLLARGFAWLRRLHRDGTARFYLTTIMAANRQAQALLTSGRAGLPTYAPLGLVRTRILASRRRPPPPLAGISIVPAQAGDLDAVLALADRVAGRRSLMPAYRAADLTADQGLLPGLGLGDLLLAWRGRDLLGCLGVWDQRPFRQQVVDGYAPWLATLRPAWNLAAPLTRQPRLPAAGAIPAQGFAALPLVRDDDAVVADQLLGHALAQARVRGLDALVLAAHADDPLAAVWRRRPGWELASHLYAVHWQDGAADVAALRRAPPYIEGGAL